MIAPFCNARRDWVRVTSQFFGRDHSRQAASIASFARVSSVPSPSRAWACSWMPRGPTTFWRFICRNLRA
jgi:hypothetical protein